MILHFSDSVAYTWYLMPNVSPSDPLSQLEHLSLSFCEACASTPALFSRNLLSEKIACTSAGIMCHPTLPHFEGTRCWPVTYWYGQCPVARYPLTF